MKRVLAVFAHPDDESFGPGGTLALWAKQGVEIKILCATCGEAGKNHTNRETKFVRCRELVEAGKILGVKHISFLKLVDGTLANKDIEGLVKRITKSIVSFRPDSIITFNLNGVSGHVDHMVVASAATTAFDKTGIAQKLYYFSNSIDHSRKVTDYFVHFPDGIEEHEADEIVDVSQVWDIKLRAMHAHISQKEDVKRILEIQKDLPKKEFFIVRNRKD